MAITTTVTYLDGVQFRAVSRGLEVISDQPFENRGRNIGMTPPELLTAALGTCMAYYAEEYLRSRGKSADGLTLTVSAEKGQNPPRLADFRVDVNAPSLDTPRHREGILRAVRSCLIHNTLTHSADVEVFIDDGNGPQNRVLSDGVDERWSRMEGSPYPLGATWIEEEQAYNFAIFSKSALSVRLLLFTSDDCISPCAEYSFDPLKNKTGPVWHARLPCKLFTGASYYAYSVEGPAPIAPRINEFRPNKLLLDPYARAVFFPPAFDRAAAQGEASNWGRAMLGVLPISQPPFDWANDHPPRHDHDLIIYELHVGGFTKNPNSRVEPPLRGTFLGVIEKIPYLKELGITAVELMPVFEFDETEPNYWGYMPLNFFSPHHRFASDQTPGQQITDFKRMVRALHAADIEVILDVVYNHTGEADQLGPTFSFKGIDCWNYYIPSGDANLPFADFSGTGNTLNCASRTVRQLIVDSLRYWVSEMHVDGFRFDLASVFSRKADGSIDFDDPPLFGDIAHDPSLEKVRLIAEPWEGNPKYPNYELGEGRNKPHFPGTGWRQWNDKFRTTTRRFMKGDRGTLRDFMTRLYGSADVFPDSIEESCRPYQSLNYVNSHDGVTLYDLVAYTTFESWNCGERDGDTGVSERVMQLRRQQVKNFCCALMLSNGTPMIHAGDEFLRTQQGDGNPYNVDSSLTWIDWSRLETHSDVFRFFSKMIAFRKRHPSLGRSTFWRDDVRWYGVEKLVDLSWDSHALAFHLLGESHRDKDIYAMFNAYWEPLTFAVQAPGDWKRVVDTSLNNLNDFVDEDQSQVLAQLSYVVQARSVVLLVSS